MYGLSCRALEGPALFLLYDFTDNVDQSNARQHYPVQTRFVKLALYETFWQLTVMQQYEIQRGIVQEWYGTGALFAPLLPPLDQAVDITRLSTAGI
tara:strand:+ start:644 stop:931 length:288 start_codon:yes stop_codon:yes gene_type:complete